MMKKKKIIIPIVILSIVILILLITLVVGNSNSPSLNEHEVGDTWVEHDEITEQPEGYDEAYFKCYGITKDDVYESYDEIDFGEIEPGAHVFYRGERGQIVHMMNTPELTEEMIVSMWNWVDSFEDFSVSKTISIYRYGSENANDHIIEHNRCIFNRKLKSYTIEDTESVVTLPSMNVESINTNTEFLQNLLSTDGLALNWSTQDAPIYDAYQNDYLFSNLNKDDIMRSKTVVEAMNTFGITNVDELEIKYTLSNSSLLFITISGDGKNSNGDAVLLSINYGLMMC